MGLLKTLRFIVHHPLNRGRPVRAVGRFARWQVRSRMTSGPVAVPFVNDARLLVGRGMHGATGNVYCGLHEFAEMALVLHALRPGDLFVDVGANVGTYTVLAGAAAGAECIAVEPAQAAFDHLLANVRLNRIEGRVDARRVCLAERAGEVRFETGHDATNRVVDAAHAGGPGVVTVPAERLDDVVGERAPTLIKIDVEGYETAVVAGATATLARPSLLAIIVETLGAGREYGFDEAALDRRLRSLGFAPMRYRPFDRALTPDVGNDEGRGEKGGAPSNNTIYVRDATTLQDRVATAKRFRVLGQLL